MKRRDAFAALADPTRRQILELLRDEGALAAGAIADRFESAARPGISRHLRILRESGLVATAPRGRARHYALNVRPVLELKRGWFASFTTAHQRGLVALRRLSEAPDDESRG